MIGVHVIIVTDCQALVFMNGLKTTNPQITRWFNILQDFDIEVRHRPGAAMSHVDALNRAPTESSSDTMDELITNRLEVLIAITEEQFVKSMQYSDPELRQIIDDLSQPMPTKTNFQNFELVSGVLYRIIKNTTGVQKLWVVPKCMRKSLVIKFHDQNGHFALDRTVAKIMEKYYFPQMKRYIRVHINMCPECALIKVPRDKPAGHLHPITPGKRPFETINIDHIGPLPRSTKENAHVLVMVDNLTKFVKVYPSKSVHSRGVIKNLQIFALTYGLPKRIISDRGTAFTADCFQQYCETNGIHHHTVSVCHPRVNGQVERVNSALLTTIMTTIKNEAE